MFLDSHDDMSIVRGQLRYIYLVGFVNRIIFKLKQTIHSPSEVRWAMIWYGAVHPEKHALEISKLLLNIAFVPAAWIRF